MKENIKLLDSSLEKLKKLRGVSYDLKKKYFGSKDPVFENKIEKERKNKIGFLAQELKEVFPEVVFLDTTNNLYSVNYSRLVPVLVEAIKEQQIQIEKLQENEKTIATLLKDIEELKTQIISIEENCCNSNLRNATINDIEENIPNQTAKLFQNSPNPFSNNTEIRCFIPSESIVAYIWYL